VVFSIGPRKKEEVAVENTEFTLAEKKHACLGLMLGTCLYDSSITKG